MSKPAKKGKDQPKDDDLSLEDKEFKAKIDLHCEHLLAGNLKEVNSLTEIVQSSTRTMTSVPKPFKFLKAHYVDMEKQFECLLPSEDKKVYADFMSMVSMIFGDKTLRPSLTYLMQGTGGDFTNWGHEYVSNLANDIGREYDLRIENGGEIEDLVALVRKIVPYFVRSNAEHDAIDLILIVDRLDDIKQYVNHSNFEKVHMYLAAACGYCADQDELVQILTTLYQISISLEEFTIALRMAIKLDDHEKVKNVFDKCTNPIVRKQLAFNAARQKIFISDLGEEENKIISNAMLAQFYKDLAKDMEVQEPKHPSDVFKMHLEENFKGNKDQRAITLHGLYVNAFVNAGLTKDAFMLNPEDPARMNNILCSKEGSKDWQLTAVASIGMLCPWDPEAITNLLMPYHDNDGEYIKAGANLGIGLASSGINDENDIAFGLLSDTVKQGTPIQRECAILGLGIAYAGRSKEELVPLLLEQVSNVNLPIKESAFAALSLGLCFVGQCNEQVTGTIIETLSVRPKEHLDSHFARYFGLGLGLLFMGQQNKCDATLETINLIEHPICKYVELMLIGCAYVGSGSVLKVQQMMHQCNSEDKESATAILAMALIASSEEIGNEMAMRMLNHILHFCPPEKKRMVPLAMAMLSVSNPKISVLDIMSKLAYDTDNEIATRAILGLGLVGAGTNNSRLAEIFRKLASYYTKDSSTLFCIRIAQGLLYMGKGMLSVQPYYSERFLMSKVAMAGLLVFLTSLIDIKQTLLDKHHHLIYFLSLAMYPKWFFVLDEKLAPVTINVRVGQAVDVVGQSGKPKKITGFQTHSSPVLINHGERAELATEQFIPIQECVLENFVIIKKNPDYVEDERPRKRTSFG